jgi:two-component system, OmpR family, response regulator MprA
VTGWRCLTGSIPFPQELCFTADSRRVLCGRPLVKFSPAILVVDDDVAVRIERVKLLRDAAYCVSSAGDFREAVRALSTDPPDLLVTELRLGAFNGLHLVIRGHADHPEMAAIVLTNFPDPVLEAEAHRLDAAYVLKPVNPMALLRIVSQRLGFVERSPSWRDPQS